MPTPAGRVALVTGASRGLGAAAARELARAGWRVAANYRSSREEAMRLAEEIGAAGGDAFPVRADVRDTGDAEAMVRAVLGRWGRIDLLVLNAAVAHESLLVSTRGEDWDAVIDVNLTGAFRCARAAARAMVRQGEGQILAVGSHLGLSGGRGESAYAASKAALVGFVMCLARELGESGVRANVAVPGFMLTEMGLSASAGARERALAASVLGRHAGVEETARGIALIAGMEGVSGQVFLLDGRIRRWA